MSEERIPAEMFPPHHFLMEEFQARNIEQKELAQALDISVPYVNDLLHGRRRMTIPVALKLETAWGISAEFWLRLWLNYDLWKARQEAK